MAARFPRVAAGITLGAVLFGASYFSPAAEVIARSAAPRKSVPSPDARSQSIRMLQYSSGDARLRDTGTYSRVEKAMPSGHTSLYVMGSSEFSVPIPQNPSTFLPAHTTDFDFFEAGRAYTDTFVHTLELAAVGRDVTNRKVTLIVSPQWFGQDNSNGEAFRTAFSAQQWRAMLDNPTLSTRTRAQVTARGQDLMHHSIWGRPGPQTTPMKVARALRTPVDDIIRRGQVLKAQSDGITSGSAFDQPFWQGRKAVPVDRLDWAAAERRAVVDARKHVTTNPYGINDRTWRSHYQGRLPALRGKMSTQDYSLDNSEWDDLQLFLDVAHDEGLSVQLIGLPMNGKWYDYAGYDRARRARWYERLDRVAKANGAQVVDLRAKEYEDYWFWDGTHPGWKGWLDVSHAAVDFARS